MAGGFESLNASRSTRGAFVASHEECNMPGHSGRDTSFQVGQASHSAALVEPECIVPNQLPSIAVYQAYDTNGPSPHDYCFGSIRTPMFFQAPNSCDRERYLRRRTGR